MICTIAASTGPQPNSWWWAWADEEELEAWWRRAKKSQDLLSNSVPHCISPQWSAWSKGPNPILVSVLALSNLEQYKGGDTEDLGFQLNNVNINIRYVNKVYYQEMPNIL